jgi:PmbA protein
MQESNMLAPNAELDRMQNLAADVIERAKRAGAEQVEVGLSMESGLNVNVRLGEVETLEHTRDRGLSLTVFVGQRKGSASTADLAPTSIQASIEQAIAIAKFTQADDCAGLADPHLLAKTMGELDLWHPWNLSAEQAIELAIACEAAGMQSDPRIRNSDGAGVNSASSLSMYANSHGFFGRDYSTSHSISASLLAGSDDEMERDYFYDAKCAADELMDAAAIGVEAARRTIARLNPQSISTRNCPILFSAELARGFIGHLLGAVSGGAQYRKASFLQGAVSQKIMPDWFELIEQPHIRRGMGSAYFDDEGVATTASPLVQNGQLLRYVLGSYSARKLGLVSTGNAGGVHNLCVKPNAGDLTDMLKRLGTGFYVTELMGQGVNGVTGDYSRGAAGFWVENGALAFPVSEVTIAGNLKTAYQDIIAAGSDLDLRGNVRSGSLLIRELTLAG